MARIFPDSPIGVLPPPVLTVFRLLKSLPDDWFVWHHLAPWEQTAPDFLVLNPQNQALLIKVSSAAARDVPLAAQMVLIGEAGPPPGQVETDILQAFLNKLPSEISAQLIPIIIFPNLPENQVRQFRPADLPPSWYWLARDTLQPGEVPTWPGFFHGPGMSALQVEYLRQLFSPEIIVPPALTVRAPLDRRLQAGLTGYLLDYDQEAILKNDLELPTASAGLERDFGLNIITGVAGSGKTLILLYRLRLLAKYYPDKQFLVLTHNRPLIRDIESRFYLLTEGGNPHVHWHTFLSWCQIHWPRDLHAWSAPLTFNERTRLVETLHQNYLKDVPVSPDMLMSEIDWIKDQVQFNRNTYINGENREGRGFRLLKTHRLLVLKAYDEYESRLSQLRRLDWPSIPVQMRRFMIEEKITPLQYDAIFVDEGQFFAPVWYDIVKRLLKPQTGHLCIAADPTQGFLRRRISWKSLGLDAYGKTHRLDRSYRSTRAIMNFATTLYRQRVGDEDESILALDLTDLPEGPIPQIIPLQSSQDEITRIVNEVETLIKHDVPKSDILILHANWQGAKQLIHYLDQHLGKGTALDPKDSHPGNYVRITTLNAGTGIESPIVFLVGLRNLFEQEQSLRLSDQEREALILDNTRKIYMAITRTGQRLVLTHSGQMQSPFTMLVNPNP